MPELHYFPNILDYAGSLHSAFFDSTGAEPYQKMSFRNRCILAGANGLLVLSIPIQGGRNVRLPYREVLICERTRWRDHHWKSIASAYGKSPWFYQYAESLHALYQLPITRLLEWNLVCLEWVDQALGFSSLNRREVKPSLSPSSLKCCTPMDYSDPSHGPFPEYLQVFSQKQGFLPNLSILDFVFCMGRPGASLLHNFRANLA